MVNVSFSLHTETPYRSLKKKIKPKPKPQWPPACLLQIWICGIKLHFTAKCYQSVSCVDTRQINLGIQHGQSAVVHCNTSNVNGKLFTLSVTKSSVFFSLSSTTRCQNQPNKKTQQKPNRWEWVKMRSALAQPETTGCMWIRSVKFFDAAHAASPNMKLIIMHIL